MRRVPGAITVDVTDDGAALAQAVTSETLGNGVRGMRERAAALGGTLDAAPDDDGSGWRVHAWLPMSTPASNAGVVTAGEADGR